MDSAQRITTLITFKVCLHLTSMYYAILLYAIITNTYITREKFKILKCTWHVASLAVN